MIAFKNSLVVLFCSALLLISCKSSDSPTQTPGNGAPSVPASPNPANGATGISRTPVLSWISTDPEAGDTVSYNVLFGTANPPVTSVAANALVASYTPSALDTNTTYYWKVTAKDNHGNSSAGPVWSFTTLHDTIGSLHNPVLALQFDEFIYNHNMHLTSDGTYLYTVNGGASSVGRIKRYTLNGTFVDSVNIALDFRGIMYNRIDGYLYASTVSGNIYRITSYASGTYTLLYTALFSNGQSTAALSWDGNFVYAFDSGTLKKYSIASGAVVQTITGLQYGSYPSNVAVAVDDSYIYTWNSSTRTVYVYDLSGTFVRTLVLTSGDYGFSLSVMNGYLFVSHDGNYSTGTWYGYNIRRLPPPAAEGVQIPVRSRTRASVSPKFGDSTSH